MKILTGKLRGRTIPFRPAVGLRPTADKVRKAVVDALAGWMQGKSVLDLYSGTGAVGMELLSAGAREILFVEKDSMRVRRIREWLAEAGFGREAEAWAMDAGVAVEKILKSGRSFDLVVMDPPYDDEPGGLWDRLKRVANKGAFLVYESRASRRALEHAGFKIVRDKTYGEARVVIYQRALG